MRAQQLRRKTSQKLRLSGQPTENWHKRHGQDDEEADDRYSKLFFLWGDANERVVLIVSHFKCQGAGATEGWAGAAWGGLYVNITILPFQTAAKSHSWNYRQSARDV